MLRYMLDTNVCIHAMRHPDSGIADHFKANAAAMCISTISLHELLYGVEKSPRPDYHRQLTMDMVSRLEILDFDAAAADHAGDIRADLAKSGALLGAYDMLIAGHARSLGLTIVTHNVREFSRVKALLLEDWQTKEIQS